jgi:hypothetical protein
MNEHFCEKEQQVVAALCGSSRDGEILGHAGRCPVCSEVLLVSEFLRESTQLAAHELSALGPLREHFSFFCSTAASSVGDPAC